MSGLVLAAEIGGTKLQAALGTPEGEILELTQGRAPSVGGADAVLSWFTTAIPELLGTPAARDREICSIGVGFGGPVNSATSEIITSHQVSGWEGRRLGEWFEDRFELPTRVVNDSNAAGWAEYRCGAGRGSKNFCYMNIGSGIGGALVVDGALYDGQGLGAFEVGHTRIPTPTGDFEKLEDLASGWSIEREARRSPPAPGTPLAELCGGDPSCIDVAMLGDAARGGDSAAHGALETAARHAGRALANAITLFHPEKIAVGGGVSHLDDLLFEPLRDEVEHWVFEPYRGRYAIVPAALKDDVVVVGALLLAPGP